MPACSRCARPIPAARRNCLYCGGKPNEPAPSSDDPETEHALAVQCLTGRGGPRDVKQGAIHLRRAAERGHEAAIMTLAANPGLWPGVTNSEEVMMWVRNAAQAGSHAAAEFLAVFGKSSM